MRLISASVIRDESTARDDLALAAATARILCPDDVLILQPWSTPLRSKSASTHSCAFGLDPIWAGKNSRTLP